METLREFRENLEKTYFSPYAFFSCDTAGRDRNEAPCEIRTEFMRDRDRIIHCKAFRRLKHKTQVFLSPEGDHYRTRLTHTLEVAQIARTIARALNLNEDLTEAIALGHDLGHTPFGHAGERTLDLASSLGFRHYEQSVRVVEKLENNGSGLNLTQEVRNGILCHTSGEEAKTLEGRTVKIADRIAYINHDIDDAIRGDIISVDDIPKSAVEILGNGKSKRINTLIRGVVFESMGKNEIAMQKDVAEACDELHKFLVEKVYFKSRAKTEEQKAENVVRLLYEYYLNNTDKLPAFYRGIADNEGEERAVLDYVSGMTDRYAISEFEKIYVPKTWEMK